MWTQHLYYQHMARNLKCVANILSVVQAGYLLPGIGCTPGSGAGAGVRFTVC